MQAAREVDPGYLVLVLKGHCWHGGVGMDVLAGTEKYPLAHGAQRVPLSTPPKPLTHPARTQYMGWGVRRGRGRAADEKQAHTCKHNTCFPYQQLRWLAGTQACDPWTAKWQHTWRAILTTDQLTGARLGPCSGHERSCQARGAGCTRWLWIGDRSSQAVLGPPTSGAVRPATPRGAYLHCWSHSKLPGACVRGFRPITNKMRVYMGCICQRACVAAPQVWPVHDRSIEPYMHPICASSSATICIYIHKQLASPTYMSSCPRFCCHCQGSCSQCGRRCLQIG